MRDRAAAMAEEEARTYEALRRRVEGGLGGQAVKL